VLDTPFFAADTTRTMARIVGQCDAGAISWARESDPSAIRDNSVGEDGNSYKFAIARTRAANPAAELARPAAVGKLFSETIFRGRVESLGSDGFVDSSFARRDRSSRKQACVRAPETSWGEELRRRESAVKRVEQAAVVWVRRSACESVTEMEEFVGRFSFGSRFPQYFTTAMFTGAVVLAW